MKMIKSLTLIALLAISASSLSAMSVAIPADATPEEQAKIMQDASAAYEKWRAENPMKLINISIEEPAPVMIK